MGITIVNYIRRSWECTSPSSVFFYNSIALTSLQLLAFNASKFRGHVAMATLPFRKIFKDSCPDWPPNPASQEVHSFNHFRAISINTQKFRGSHDSGHAPFSKNFSGVMSGLSLGTCKSNLKSAALTVLNWSDWPVCCAQTHRHTHTSTKTVSPPFNSFTWQ